MPASDAGLGEGEEYELRPASAPLYDIEADAKIVSWRADCFEKKGFAPAAATMLAMRRDVDREAVERMRDQGATTAQVLELVT